MGVASSVGRAGNVERGGKPHSIVMLRDLTYCFVPGLRVFSQESWSSQEKTGLFGSILRKESIKGLAKSLPPG